MKSPPPATVPSERATPALVLGILSIVFSGCFPAGLVLGCIGIAKARAGFAQLQGNPELMGRGELQAGRICCIIGTVLSAIQAVVWVLYALVILFLILFSIDTNPVPRPVTDEPISIFDTNPVPRPTPVVEPQPDPNPEY